MSLSDLGETMTWGEAIRLTQRLAADPSSWVCAALAGWKHPFAWESVLLADLFDLQHASKARHRPKPWPFRPWVTNKVAKPAVPQEEVIAALRRAGHTRPLPALMAP